jgi:hypothetical protein
MGRGDGACGAFIPLWLSALRTFTLLTQVDLIACPLSKSCPVVPEQASASLHRCRYKVFTLKLPLTWVIKKASSAGIRALNVDGESPLVFYPVVIVGAGPSGIAMGCRLKKKLGCDQFRIFERQGGVGGKTFFPCCY